MSLKSYPNCFCYKHCSLRFYVSIQYVLFYFAFVFIFIFSKLWTTPSFSFWHPVYFSSPFPYLLFCFPAPLLSLNKSVWLEQPSTACHINFILLQIPLEKSPFLSSSVLTWTFLKLNLSVLIVTDTLIACLRWFSNYSFTLKWHHHKSEWT